jgi:hypothetical protein
VEVKSAFFFQACIHSIYIVSTVLSAIPRSAFHQRSHTPIYFSQNYNPTQNGARTLDSPRVSSTCSPASTKATGTPGAGHWKPRTCGRGVSWRAHDISKYISKSTRGASIRDNPKACH